ncbi:MAG: hypothetical protein V3U72_01525 [Candidatus Aenigmarchaeota archaeon]
MGMRGRQFKILNTSQSSHENNYHIIVYQKKEDCNRDAFPYVEGRKYWCNGDCNEIFMSLKLENGILAIHELLVPQVEYFNYKEIAIPQVYDFDHLDKFCKEHGLPIISEEGTKIFMYGEERRTLGVERFKCGMERIGLNLWTEENEHTFNEILSRKKYFEEMLRKANDGLLH